MIGLGMATAIVVDALIIRTVLVPAAMHWLGNANWYFPHWIDRSLPRLDLERLDESQLELDSTAEPPERSDSVLALDPTFRRQSRIPG
jgi:RND superfamily putative drug exporter